TTFPDRLPQAEKAYCEIIKALEGSEEVELIVRNDVEKSRIEALLTDYGIDASKISFHVTEYVDVWTRDFGPVFLKNDKTHELAWVKWDYNGYGKADDPYFTDLLKDNSVFLNLRKEIDKRMFEPGI